MNRRLADYVRMSIFIAGLLAIALSWVVVLHAQNNSYLPEQVKDLSQQQRTDQEKISVMDKRLAVIEAKQDFITQLIYGIGGAIGLMLADRVRAVFASVRNRKESNED